MTYDLIGRQIGPYRVDALVGTGGMAEVYKAYQPSMDRFVALKALPTALSSQPEFLERFRREAILIASLNHTHILPVYDYGQADGHAYLVMPLMENGTIASRVAGKRVAVDQVIRVGTQVGDALDFAHAKGMVHRDVKPGNILLDARGNCLLSDFGIARIAADLSGFTTSHGLIGTPAYISPEQADGGIVDGRADQYSLAIVLYELATGRRPFDSTDQYALIYQHVNNAPKPIREIDAALPEQLQWVIMRALNKRPDERFESTGEMARALRNVSFRVKPGADSSGVSLMPQSEAKPIAPDAATVLRPKNERDAQRKSRFTLRMPTLRLPTRRLPTATPTIPKSRIANPLPKSSRPATALLPIQSKVIQAVRRAAPGAKSLRMPDLMRYPYLIAGIGVALVIGFAAFVSATLPRRPVEPTPVAELARPAPSALPPIPTLAAAQPVTVQNAAMAQPIANAPPVFPTETPISRVAASGTALSAPLNCAQLIVQNALAPAVALQDSLGCPSQSFVSNRRVLVQSFERGIMVLFARTDGALEGPGGALYVLSQDGRAWRFTSVWSQPNNSAQDGLYVCQRASGLTPAQSGVPWRHFGAVWCGNDAIREALGAALSDEYLNAFSAFQSYDNGRVFQISNWPGGNAGFGDRPLSVLLQNERDGVWQ